MRPFEWSAAVYDALYRDKDYEGEVDVVLALLESAMGRRPGAIADLGCGTGRHAECMGRRGIGVLGIDASPAMVALAEKRCAGLPVRCLQGDIAAPPDLRACDGVVSLFHAIGYLADPGGVERGLRAIRGRMAPGSALLFDFWNAVAVLRHGCERRERTVVDGDRTIQRIAEPRLVPGSDTAEIAFTYRIYQPERVLAQEAVEVHRMRYLDPEALRRALHEAGFAVRAIAAWGQRAGPVGDAWSAYALAVAT